MDRKLSQQQEIQRLIHSSDAARHYLNREASLLQHRLDIPSRLKDSLKSNPTGWMVGSLASGLSLNMLFRKKTAPAEPKKNSTRSTIPSFIVSAARPLVKIWLADQIKSYLSNRLNPPAQTQRPR
jgi:hypothetical protein